MKNKIIRQCFLFYFLIGLVSCANIDTENMESQTYFDLSGFVDNQIAKQDDGLTVNKIVSLDGVSEEKNISNYELTEELGILKKYDINKVSLLGKYDVKVSQENGLELTQYLANEEKLKTKALSVWKNGIQIAKIEVEAQLSTIMATSDQKIIYEPAKSFQMISKDVNKYSNDLMKEILITYQSF